MIKEMTKRKIQAEATKKKLLATAKKLVQEHGFDNVSIESVVEGAGVSKGAFYVHFESKDALALLLVEDYVNSVDSDYESFIKTLSLDMPIADKLFALIGKIADVIQSIGWANMKFLYKAHLTQNIDSTSASSYNRKIYYVVSDLLEKGVEQGEFKTDLPIDALAKHCIIALRGVTFEWCIHYPEFDLKEQYLNHFNILLKGMLRC